MIPNNILYTECDMGNIKIFSKDVSLFFGNDVGDVTNTVKIYRKRWGDKPKSFKWLGHFTVKKSNNANVWLSTYDCEDDPLYHFSVGRWWVYLEKNTANFHIFKIDKDLHA